jgi:hypothetical protein
MNHAISTLNNLAADTKAQLAAQGARLEALSDGVGAIASALGPLAAWSAAAFVIQLALLLFALHPAQALLSFVRRRESPVMRLVSPISTGFMLVGSAMLKTYRGCCRRAGGDEAPANPPPASEVSRDQWLGYPCGQHYGGGEFLGVSSRGAGSIV